jgi:hypothetical protein
MIETAGILKGLPARMLDNFFSKSDRPVYVVHFKPLTRVAVEDWSVNKKAAEHAADKRSLSADLAVTRVTKVQWGKVEK